MISLINKECLSSTIKAAKLSPRLRMNHNFHELSDVVQKMLNAIEPDSYIRPHRHITPERSEMFLVLTGRGAVIIFDNDGGIKEVYKLEVGQDILGIDIYPGVWHTVLALETGTVFMEVKEGPYVAISDKDFAPWAPAPGDDQYKKYMVGLQEVVKNR